jgi:hypothetical protein
MKKNMDNIPRHDNVELVEGKKHKDLQEKKIP